MKTKCMTLGLIVLLSSSSMVVAEVGQHTETNTSVNAMDKDANTVLPEDQSNEQRYIDRTAAIRKEIMNQDSLSVAAKNVKIVTLNSGMVVLRGPVQTSQEKELIETIARNVAGESKVNSQLQVNN